MYRPIPETIYHRPIYGGIVYEWPEDVLTPGGVGGGGSSGKMSGEMSCQNLIL